MWQRMIQWFSLIRFLFSKADVFLGYDPTQPKGIEWNRRRWGYERNPMMRDRARSWRRGLGETEAERRGVRGVRREGFWGQINEDGAVVGVGGVAVYVASVAY